MADGLSIATSAIQVADAGFKLYGALLQYLKDLRDANKYHKRLADEVRTTSWALQQLSSLLQDDDDLKLCKPEAISETKNALDGCKAAFDEVSSIISSATAKSQNGTTMPFSERLRWPLKKNKVLILLAQLERLKTTLLLVFKVLSYASKIASRSSKRDLVLLDEKTQLTYLVRAKKQAANNEQKLLAKDLAVRSSDVVSPTGTQDGHAGNEGMKTPGRTSSQNTAVVGNDDSLTERHHPQPVGTGSPIGRTQSGDLPTLDQQNLFVGAVTIPPELTPATVAAQQQPEQVKVETLARDHRPLSYRKRRMASQLEVCVSAVARLSSALEQAKADLDRREYLEVRRITKSLRATQRAMDDLVRAELEEDSDEADSDLLRETAVPVCRRRRRSSSDARRKVSRDRSFSPTGSMIVELSGDMRSVSAVSLALSTHSMLSEATSASDFMHNAGAYFDTTTTSSTSYVHSPVILSAERCSCHDTEPRFDDRLQSPPELSMSSSDHNAYDIWDDPSQLSPRFTALACFDGKDTANTDSGSDLLGRDASALESFSTSSVSLPATLKPIDRMNSNSEGPPLNKTRAVERPFSAVEHNDSDSDDDEDAGWEREDDVINELLSKWTTVDVADG